MAQKRDTSIELIRALSMVMIVIIHVTDVAYNKAIFGYLLTFAVQLFLFLSGWLYSEYDIPKAGQWLKKRWFKLMLPVWLWATFVYVVIVSISKQYSLLKGYPLYLLDLQGLMDIFEPLKILPVYVSLGELWFVTVIMLCYLTVPLVKKWEKDHEVIGSKKQLALYWLLGNLLVLALSAIGFSIEWGFIFYAGYFGKRIWEKISGKEVFLTCLILVPLALGLRFAGKMLFDGGWIYQFGFVCIGNNLICLCAFVFLKYGCEHWHWLDAISRWKAVRIFDSYSYEIYVVHYAVIYFIVGMLGNGIKEFLLMVLLTAGFTWILAKVSRKLYQIIIK